MDLHGNSADSGPHWPWARVGALALFLLTGLLMLASLNAARSDDTAALSGPAGIQIQNN
jgi:hypothetical protein